MNPPRYTAWVLARRMVGEAETDAEPAALSGPWRALADRLAAATPADRQAILEGFRLAQADPDAILQAIGDQNPYGPPPAAAPNPAAVDVPRWRMFVASWQTRLGRGPAGWPPVCSTRWPPIRGSARRSWP